MFCNFCEKFENSKWPPFLPRQIFFENRHGYSAEIPCGSKISSKSLYLAGFSRYKHFYVLQFLRKIQNGRHFWRNKIFLKIGMATLQRYPVGQKFRRNRSIYNLARFSLVSLVAQLVGCWTHNPRVVGSIPGEADCFIWDNIPGQDVILDCASPHPGVMGTWLLVGL